MPDAHHHIHATGTDSQLKRRLFVSIVFTGVVFVVELIGGYLTNSLALGSTRRTSSWTRWRSL